jgi:Coenzyme PQQ synthesis protein D (PqqD)
MTMQEERGVVGSVYQLRSDELTWREAGDVVVVLDLADSSYLSIGGSGRVLWRRLEAGATVDELVGTLVEVFDVDDATARADTLSFLASLTERRLLTVSD